MTRHFHGSLPIIVSRMEQSVSTLVSLPHCATVDDGRTKSFQSRVKSVLQVYNEASFLPHVWPSSDICIFPFSFLIRTLRIRKWKGISPSHPFCLSSYLSHLRLFPNENIISSPLNDPKNLYELESFELSRFDRICSCWRFRMMLIQISYDII